MVSPVIVQEFRSSGVQEFRSSGVQEFRSSGVQERLARQSDLKKSSYSVRFSSAMSVPENLCVESHPEIENGRKPIHQFTRRK
jgi:hypothetical protein